MIAAVRSINRSATQNSYIVEDGTGVIDARRYPSDTEDVEEAAAIRYMMFSVLHTLVI